MKKPEIKRTADGKEMRSFSGTLELRAAEQFAITGIAAAYGVRSAPIGGQFVEIIQPGAFASTLRSDDIVCCQNHDTNQLLGRKSSGTLQLEDSPAGLKFRCQLDKTNPVHQAVYASVKRGDLNGCSFQFSLQPDGDTWAEEQDGTVLRTLRAVKLYELGPVVFPAYVTGTSVGARAEQRSDYFLHSLENWRTLAMAKLHKLDAQYKQQQCETIGRIIAADKESK
jgi:HK97 family phage prohead protease